MDEDLVDQHIVRKIKPPKPEQKLIIPFTQQDVKSMLVACERSIPHRRVKQQATYSYALSNVKRNKAMIITLLDTGIRASELCNAKIADLDLNNQQLKVLGKGKKQRALELSDRTTEVIKHYLATRVELPEDAPVFAGDRSSSFSRNGLQHLINRIGKRASVRKAHPHRFRHTFAINFLRNGGNIYALQKLLGHSTLDMVKRYLALSEQDCAAAHRIASPVTNWDL